TPDIPYNASFSEVQEALEALPAIGEGNVRVLGGPGNATGSTPYEVTFIGDLAATDVEELAVASSTSQPLLGSASVETYVPAGPSPSESQLLRVAASGGTFRLSFEGQSTPDLPFDASGAEVQSALEGLTGIGSGNVLVFGGPGDATASAPYLVI